MQISTGLQNNTEYTLCTTWILRFLISSVLFLIKLCTDWLVVICLDKQRVFGLGTVTVPDTNLLVAYLSFDTTTLMYNFEVIV